MSEENAKIGEFAFAILFGCRCMNALSFAGGTERNEVFFLEVRVTANLGDELGRQ